MKKIFGMSVLCVALVAFVGCASTARYRGVDTPRMTKAELKAILGSPDLVVIDVRQGGDWKKSAIKIKGAVRESPRDIAWASKYPKGKTIVLYCS